MATTPSKTLQLISKKKYAILLGYSGAGYAGMQINPDVKTIEGEVLAALRKLNTITDDMVAQPSRAGWMRAARTDKGVHSLGNVISVKLRLPMHPEHPPPPQPTPEEQQNMKKDKKLKMKFEAEQSNLTRIATKAAAKVFVKEINNILPDQIRVYDCVQVTRSFHAKTNCTGRQYEYLLPTYVFAKQNKIWDITATLASELESGKLGDDQVEWDQHKLEKLVVEKISNEFSEEERNRLICPSVDKDDEESQEKLRQWIVAERNRRAEAYRIDQETLSKLEEALGCYVGTHTYHNFTSGLNPGDDQAKRYITAFTCSKPMMFQGLEFVRLRVDGQSFVLNQIRKMVGLAVEVVRRGEETSTLQLAFGTRKMDVPMAPACGLVLRAALFEYYNRDYGTAGLKSVGDGLEFDLPDERRLAMEECAEKVVYPTMLRDEMEKGEFLSWTHLWDKRKFPNQGEEMSVHERGAKVKRHAIYTANLKQFKKKQKSGSGADGSDHTAKEVEEFLRHE